MQPMMIVLRLFHIFSGVLWVGGVAMLSWFIIPAVEGSGPAGGGVMKFLLVKTKFGPYFPALGGLTVLSGIFMYWWDASRSNGAFYSSPMGMTLGVGGLAGVIALVFGGAVVGRATAGMATIFRAVDAQGGPPTARGPPRHVTPGRADRRAHDTSGQGRLGRQDRAADVAPRRDRDGHRAVRLTRTLHTRALE